MMESLLDARDRYVRPGDAILDVGCGDMPYYPLFADLAGTYDGTDLEPGPRIKYICPIEALTADDASYDVVLCTQVLEHVREPRAGMRELARVLRPGGHALLTTHGIWPFHPYPADYNRWTQQGIEALVEDTDGLSLVELVPHRGTVACFALMVNYYVEVIARRAHAVPLGWGVCALVNALGAAGDRIGRLRYPNNDTLIHNFLAVARRDPA
jgi:SAM-dependent methyltransferase